MRSGCQALSAALNGVRCEDSRTAIVVASEARDGEPGGPAEPAFGDAAAGVAVSAENVVAEVEACAFRAGRLGSAPRGGEISGPLDSRR